MSTDYCQTVAAAMAAADSTADGTANSTADSTADSTAESIADGAADSAAGIKWESTVALAYTMLADHTQSWPTSIHQVIVY